MNARISAHTKSIEKVSIKPKEAGHDQSDSAAITITKEQTRIKIRTTNFWFFFFFGVGENNFGN